jgi:hypothetical protein
LSVGWPPIPAQAVGIGGVAEPADLCGGWPAERRSGIGDVGISRVRRRFRSGIHPGKQRRAIRFGKCNIVMKLLT